MLCNPVNASLFCAYRLIKHLNLGLSCAMIAACRHDLHPSGVSLRSVLLHVVDLVFFHHLALITVLSRRPVMQYEVSSALIVPPIHRHFSTLYIHTIFHIGSLYFLAETMAEPFGWAYNHVKPKMSQKVIFSFGLSHGSVRTFGSAEPFGSDQSSDWATAETKLNLNLQAKSTWFNTAEIA